MLSFSSTSTPKSFSSGLLSIHLWSRLIAPTHVQDLALGLVNLHEVHMVPPLKPVQVPLDGIPSLQCGNSTSLVLSANLLSVHAILLSMSPAKMLNNTAPSTDRRGTPLLTCEPTFSFLPRFLPAIAISLLLLVGRREDFVLLALSDYCSEPGGLWKDLARLIQDKLGQSPSSLLISCVSAFFLH